MTTKEYKTITNAIEELKSSVSFMDTEQDKLNLLNHIDALEWVLSISNISGIKSKTTPPDDD